MAFQSSLKVLGGSLDGRELVLEDAPGEFSIGADASCRLRVDLPGVSPIHARLRREAAGDSVRDESGGRGVFVNDDAVRGEAALRNGDILWLGPPGDGQSVMIQCRLAPVAAIASPVARTTAVADKPAAPGADEEQFFIADPALTAEASTPQDEFLLAPEVAGTAAPLPVPAPPEDDFFIVEEETPPASVAPASRASSPAAPPAVGPPAIAPPIAATGSAPAPHAPREPERLAVPGPAAPSAPAFGAVATRPAVDPVKPAATPSPSRAAGAPPARPAAHQPQAAEPRPRTARRRPAAEPGAAPSPKRRASRTGGASPAARYAAIAAGVLVLMSGGFAALRFFDAPRLDSVNPTRVKVGQLVTLAGKNFALDEQGNRVRFGDRAAKVLEASAQRIQAEVPEVATTAGRDATFPVTVEVGGRATGAVEIAVFQSPRIHGLSPDVAMPGDELTLAGSGWGPGAAVSFGSAAAEVLQVSSSTLRVRVPESLGSPGTSVPVVVAMGEDRSNAAPFMVGRLPLLQGIEPAAAAPGDVVTLRGRGFQVEPRANAVLVGGVPALVAASNAGELRIVVPWAPAGEVAVEVRVPPSSDAGRGTISVAPAADPIEWRFSAETFDDAPGHAHAFLATALGPALVLTSAGGQSAAERVLEAARRLHEAAGPLRASLDADFQASGALVQLTPKGTPVLEASAEDAAAYNEDWTRLGGRGGPVTPERLALWWTALARDLVLILLRSQKPVHAVAAGAEGRILGDIFQGARRTGRFGVPRQLAAELTPAQRQALRLLAQRVPPSLAGPAPSVPGAAGSSVTLKLQGNWTGFENDAGAQKFIAVRFGRNGGTLTFTGAVSIGVPLLLVETPQRNSVRFSAEVRGGVRYYQGAWDGEKLKGRISRDPGGSNVVGTFELRPGP